MVTSTLIFSALQVCKLYSVSGLLYEVICSYPNSHLTVNTKFLVHMHHFLSFLHIFDLL